MRPRDAWRFELTAQNKLIVVWPGNNCEAPAVNHNVSDFLPENFIRTAST
jgi:hypothetical protein